MVNMRLRILTFLTFSVALAKNVQGAASPLSPSPITSFDPSLLEKGKVYHFRPVSFGSDGPNLFLSGNSEDKSINFKYPSLAAFQSISDPEAQASSRFPAATEPEEVVADSAAEEVVEVKKFVKIIPPSSSSVEGSSEESASGSIGAESQRREKRKKAKKSSSSEIPWDASYAFGYTFDDQSRHEVSDPDGNVNGYYQYIDDEGYVRKVVYTAGAGKGFVILNKQRTKSPVAEIIGGHKRPHKGPPSPPGRPHGGSHTPEYPEQDEDDEDEDIRRKNPIPEIIGGHKRPHKGPPSPPGRPHGGSHTPEYPEQDEDDEDEDIRRKNPLPEIIGGHKRPHKGPPSPPGRPHSGGSHTPEYPEREEDEDIGHRPRPSHPPPTHGRPVPPQFGNGPPEDANNGYPGFEGPPRPPKKGRDKPIYVVKIRRPSSPRPKTHGTSPHRPSVHRPPPSVSESDDDEDDGSYKEEYNHHHEGSDEASYSGGPKPDPSYSFGYETETANRLEKADNFGNVRGSYSYIDNDGIKRTVHYIAGASTGFQVLKTSPTKPHSVRIEAPTGFVVSKKLSPKSPSSKVPIPLIAPAGLTTAEFRYLPSSQPSTIVYHIHPESNWRPWDIPGGSRPRKMRKVMRIRKKSKSSKSRPKGASSRTVEIEGGVPSERRFFKESSKTGPITTPPKEQEEAPKTFRHSTRVTTNPSDTPFFVIPRSSLKRHASHRAYTDLHGPLEDDDAYFTVKGKSDDPILFSPSLESLTTAQDTRRPIPNPILLKSPSVQIRNLGSVGSINAESGAGILAPVTETSESRPYPERQDLTQERSSTGINDGLNENDQRPVTISPTESPSPSFYSTQREEDDGYEVTPPTFEETEDYTFSSTAQPHIQNDDPRDRGRGFMMSSNQFARAIHNNEARKVEAETERREEANVNYAPLMSSSARLMQRLGIETGRSN